MNEAVHPAFESLGIRHIADLQLSVEVYRHKKLGTRHYHLASDNQENVFLVGLCTAPEDSTGVAHILEHTVLCGSKKYPVRDPFFMMIRRSLNTFMNAFTSSDWTAYPFASVNKTDFNNLMDVYLDAVFFPLLEPLDFLQEGHRLEFEDMENPDSDLVYKGVVYNEMKGAMSSPTNFAWQRLTSNLYLDTTYHYNSGGDPQEIPSLKYEELKQFYQTHYHPSNAVFFTFGDIPAARHQKKFHEQALRYFDTRLTPVSINRSRRYTEPQAVTEPYAADDEQARAHVLLGWLLGESTDLLQQLTAVLVSGALLDNSASPLRQALENTDLGVAPSPLCGLEESNKEMAFICGLEGVQPGAEKAVEQLVLDVLQKVAETGIPHAQLEAVLHQIELSQREITGGSYPYGLQLILDMLPQAIHQGDPVDTLDLQGILDTLRESIKDPAFIRNQVRALLLDNSHRLLLNLVPDTQMKQRLIDEEKQRLAAIKAGLSEAEKRTIIEQSLALKARQQQADDPGLLPKVGIDEVPATFPVPKGEKQSIAGLPGEVYVQGTNGIIYEQLVTQLPPLNPEEQQLLPLYTQVLCDLGFGDKTYLDVQALLDSHTGGIHTYTSMRSHAFDLGRNQSYLVLSGKALAHKQDKLAELMLGFFNDARFDELERIRELVAQWRVRRENSITGSGHSLAMLAASRGMSPLAAYKHHSRGLRGILQVKAWDEAFHDRDVLRAVAQQLALLHQKIQQSEKQYLLVGDENHLHEVIGTREQNYQSLPATKTHDALALPEPDTAENQCWITNTQVNFCATAYPAAAPYHEDGAALMVLGGYLKNGYLHGAIREQGGAYGAGAGYDADAGAFRFYSYRDPRLNETLADFTASIHWLLNEKQTDSQLEEAILGVISRMDKPSSPAGEAKAEFYNHLFGRSVALRQELRHRILSTRLADLRAVAERYLHGKEPVTAVVTNPENSQKLAIDEVTINKL